MFSSIDGNWWNITIIKNAAPGFDEIGAVLLKGISNNINERLVYTCNLSLNEDIFPKELKLTNVLLLFQYNDPFVFKTTGLCLCCVYY